MLVELKVTNFAIIENLDIHFKSGLNVLSGETGAGKSVLLKSLSLLMGVKGSAESIRTGATQASIEGSFDLTKRPDLKIKLNQMGIKCDDDTLIVRRVLQEDKSRVYINGNLCTLQNLRDMVAPLIEVAGHSAPLIEMTGQHENRHLLSTSYHLDLLDQYVGAWELRHQFQSKFEQWQALKLELDNFNKQSVGKTQRLDFLKFQRNEIVELDLSPGEENELETQLKKLKNANKIDAFVESAESTLYSDDDSAASRIHAILQRFSEIVNLDAELKSKMENLEQARSLIEDTVYDLKKYCSQMEADPKNLDALEKRFSDLRKLQKKYGASSDEILQALLNIETEIGQLENSEAHSVKLGSEILKLEKELLKMAETLHDKRLSGAILLQNSVNEELLDLNMKGVTFHVMISKNNSLNSTGISNVEFMSKTSPKDPERSLAKFASGGELSRILLSLKRVIGTTHQPRTYLFDEVDTGVSGTTAEKVGKKLKSIAKGQQVICITHLPQVAAFGDHHFFIQKSSDHGFAQMEVTELEKKERVQEIARLISGEKITKTSLAHADQLLKEARL